MISTCITKVSENKQVNGHIILCIVLSGTWKNTSITNPNLCSIWDVVRPNFRKLWPKCAGWGHLILLRINLLFKLRILLIFLSRIPLLMPVSSVYRLWGSIILSLFRKPKGFSRREANCSFLKCKVDPRIGRALSIWSKA